MSEENKKTNEVWNENLSFNSLIDDDLLNDWVGVESINKLRKNEQKITLKTKILGYLSLVLFIIVGLLFSVYYFFYLTLKPYDSLNDYQKMYLNFVKNNIINLFISNQYTQTPESYVSVKNPIDKELELEKYLIDKAVSFYDKLNFKEKLNKYLKSKLINIKWEISNYQHLLVKYRYYSKELKNVVKEIRILPILLSLNSIKIYITDYVFIKSWLFDSKIWSFVQPRSSFVWTYSLVSSDAIKNRTISDILKFWGEGVSIYLKNIYFNYMYSSDDIFANSYFINSFKKRFKSVLENDYEWIKKYYPNIDKNDFYAKYIMLIKQIYDRTVNLFNQDQTDFMPVDVQLISYNPSTEQLSFSVRLMLSPEVVSKVDPVSLMSNIVTLLRESRLIIWKNIKYDGLKVNTVTKMVWWYKIVYQTAEKKFISSVQSPVNIEVTDKN